MKLKINQRIWQNVILNESHSAEKNQQQQYIDLLLQQNVDGGILLCGIDWHLLDFEYEKEKLKSKSIRLLIYLCDAISSKE